jgi:hypothetical protein
MQEFDGALLAMASSSEQYPPPKRCLDKCTLYNLIYSPRFMYCRISMELADRQPAPPLLQVESSSSSLKRSTIHIFRRIGWI